MRYKVISFDGKIYIEVKKQYTQKPNFSENFAVINLGARGKVTLTDIQMAIVDCLDGTLEFKIHPDYKKIVIYFHKEQSAKGKKFVIENDIDNVIFDLADQLTM